MASRNPFLLRCSSWLRQLFVTVAAALPSMATLRPIMHWTYSGVFLPLLGSIGLGMALADKFGLAYTFFVAAGVWALLFFLTSKDITGKRNVVKLVGSAFICSACISCCLWTRSIQIDKELEALGGWLYPSDEVITPSCDLPIGSEDVILMVGDSAYIEDGFPHVVIAVGCEPILTLDRDAHGAVGISLTVRDKEGKVVVDINSGRFDVNRNNYFKIDRKGSRSTLYVFDQYNQEVLYLHLANKKVLQMRAALYDRGRRRIIDGSHWGGGQNCFGHSVVDIQIGTCLP